MKKIHFIFVFLILSQISYSQSKIDSLKEYITESFQGDDSLLAKNYSTLAEYYYKLGDMSLALDNYSTSLEIARKIENNKLIADAQQSIGLLHRYFGNYDESILFHINALKNYEFLKDSSSMAAATNSLGVIYRNLGYYETAYRYYTKALKLRKELDDKHELSESYNDLGSFYWYKGNYAKALEYYSLALDLRRIYCESKDHLAGSLNNIGNTYRELNKPDKAFLYYKESLELSIKIGDQKLSAVTQKNLAELFKKEKKYDESIEYLNKAFVLADSVNYTRVKLELFFLAYEIYKAKGDINNSLTNFEKYIALKDSIFSGNVQKRISEYATRYEIEKKELEFERKENEKEASFRYIIFTFLGMLVLALITLVWMYSSKIQMYNIVASQNLTITSKNEELENLNSELKESLDIVLETKNTLKEREAILNSVFLAAPIGITILENHNFSWSNQKFSELIGYHQDELKNISINSLFAKSMDAEIFLEGLSEINSFEVLWKNNNGKKIYILLNSAPLSHSENKVLLTAQDITMRKKIEDDLIIAKNLAEESDKLKSEFLAQISHEIRTPVNTIINYTSLINLELGDNKNEIIIEAFESIQNSSNRLIRTIDLVINMSELETGSYIPLIEEFDLIQSVIDPLLLEFKNSAYSKGLELGLINRTKNMKRVYADIYTITQILSNLIDNAIKYTFKGSVLIELSNNQSNLVIDVIDSGVGIATEYIPKLFDKFSQEEQGYTRKFDGSGLGLALVKKYCEINNIIIDVKSSKDQGSRFRIIFPPESLV